LAVPGRWRRTRGKRAAAVGTQYRFPHFSLHAGDLRLDVRVQVEEDRRSPNRAIIHRSCVPIASAR
jgi:hypothetical protein